MDIKNTWRELSATAEHQFNRATQQNIRLAVTGFSGAGKSTFITSLLNQLIYVNKHHQLPLFSLSSQQRIEAVRIESSDDLTLPRFDFEKGISQLTAGHWPESTADVSTIRLRIRYQTTQPILRSVKKTAELTLDIVDYPGEWLLDLLMLPMDYAEWSDYACGLLSQQADDSWLETLNQCDDFSMTGIKRLAADYLERVNQLVEEGAVVTPGRMVIPGRLANTPVLDFFPLPGSLRTSMPETAESLERVFDQFKTQVIEPFFQDFFAQVDRQIVLQDCLSLLRLSSTAAAAQLDAYARLVPMFSHGHSSWLTRLFKPKIDRVVFAATKADHVPVDQQHRLTQLLKQIFYRSDADIKFANANADYVTFAAVRAATPVVAELDQNRTHCVKGFIGSDTSSSIVFPGELPETIEQWLDGSHVYDLPQFRPVDVAEDSVPHIRMDKVIEMLIGDCFW